MKVLLLHPQDSPWQTPWASVKWDLVLDLGWAGRPAYEEWSHKLSCPVLGLYDFGREIEDAREVKGILSEGYGHLLDSQGVDWWEVLSPMIRYELLTLLLLLRINEYLRPAEDIAATRSNLHVRVLDLLRGKDIRYFSPRESISPWPRLERYANLIWKSRSVSLLIEGALDKWDPVYRFRRWIPTRRNGSSCEPVVLLPSGYINVSRTVAQYAKMLPDQRFLLVTIRRSDRHIESLPNVRMTSLASYVAAPSSTSEEFSRLMSIWKQFREEVILKVRVLALADRMGIFSSYPVLVQRGLVIRDAWRRVFEREPIKTVLCGDENNPITRLPVILANKRGILTMNCHHGALDGNMLVNKHASSVYLAKMKMEEDYLVNVCGLAQERIMLGAAGQGPLPSRVRGEFDRSQAPLIVFFSEPHEIYFGRMEEAYKEVLPRLCGVARRTHRKVVLKLHPYESRRARTRIVNRILSADDRSLVEIIAGPLSADLLENTWFGVAIESSVTVECAQQGIPCFLCEWLDAIRYGYMRQYARFGAGYLIDSPDDIDRIPELLKTRRFPMNTEQILPHPIGADEIGRLFKGHNTISA